MIDSGKIDDRYQCVRWKSMPVIKSHSIRECAASRVPGCCVLTAFITHFSAGGGGSAKPRSGARGAGVAVLIGVDQPLDIPGTGTLLVYRQPP